MNASLLQPTLAGDLVHLAPLRAEDLDALYEVAKDPLIWAQHPSWDRYKPEVFRPVFDSGLASGGALVVRDAATGTVIGSTTTVRRRIRSRSVTPSWRVAAGVAATTTR